MIPTQLTQRMNFNAFRYSGGHIHLRRTTETIGQNNRNRETTKTNN